MLYAQNFARAVPWRERRQINTSTRCLSARPQATGERTPIAARSAGAMEYARIAKYQQNISAQVKMKARTHTQKFRNIYIYMYVVAFVVVVGNTKLLNTVRSFIYGFLHSLILGFENLSTPLVLLLVYNGENCSFNRIGGKKLCIIGIFHKKFVFSA